MTRPFANNLDKNNRVLDVITNRQGKVAIQPRESTRMTKVIFDGRSSGQYVDVMNLRLILDGRQAEDVPPIDGDPPPLPEGNDGPRRAFSARTAGVAPALQGFDAVAILKTQRADNETEKSKITERFKALAAENERLDKAITALTS